MADRNRNTTTFPLDPTVQPKPKYRPFESSSEPFTFGYYVFDLPNGTVLNMMSPDPEAVLEGLDLSKLPRRYVERVLR